MSISIRKWRLSDAHNLASVLSNTKITDNLRDGFPSPYTEDDARIFITEAICAPADETYSFAITDNDKVIGSIGVFRQDNIHSRTAEMGYYLAEEYWGRGIMTSIIQRVSGYIFKNTDIIRIFAEPFAHNTASCRALEKAGFECEGILRSNAFKNGKVLDMKMYSLLKYEFKYI